MANPRKFGSLFFTLVICSGFAAAADSPVSSVTLGKLPAVALAAHKPLSKEETEKIKACIRRLAEIDKPDFGLSASMSGDAFLPIEKREKLLHDAADGPRPQVIRRAEVPRCDWSRCVAVAVGGTGR